MNIGFMEAMKLEQFDCVIFHDVDLLPQNDRNMYTCPDKSVRHMSAYIDKFNYKYVIYCMLIPWFETSNQTVANTDSEPNKTIAMRVPLSLYGNTSL